MKAIFFLLAILAMSAQAADQLTYNKLHCGEIRQMEKTDACPEMDAFIKDAFATCMDYNLTSRLWAQDQKARTENQNSKYFTEYMTARIGLRKQFVITLNEFTVLKAKPACQELIRKGEASKALETLNEAAKLTDMTSASLGVVEPEPKGDDGTK